jgi:Cu/Ag efflux pump CusA
MRHTPLDAIPDLSDIQVIIRTEWPGRSPDLIEDQITYPIVTALVPTPGVRSVRGFTDFGVSSVYVIFEDGTDVRAEPRSRVSAGSADRTAGWRHAGDWTRGDRSRLGLPIRTRG